MNNTRILTDEQVDKAYDEWLNGKKQTYIAKELYVSDRTLRRAFKRKRIEDNMKVGDMV